MSLILIIFSNIIHIIDRPVLTRGETIDNCCTDDLVTVLEINKVEKRPFKVTDRVRLFRKGIMAATLEDLLQKGENIENQIMSNIYNSFNFSQRKVWNK